MLAVLEEALIWASVGDKIPTWAQYPPEKVTGGKDAGCDKWTAGDYSVSKKLIH